MNVHDHEGVQTFLDDLGLRLRPERFRPRYNLAPTDPVHAVFEDQSRQLVEMRWGFIPRNPAQRGVMINARSESAWQKPSFRQAMRTRRAVIPVNGFYEWRRVDGSKRPYYITGPDKVLALAGLYAVDDNGEMRCCVLTRRANETMQQVHDRMPVALQPENIDAWFRSDREGVDELISMSLAQPFLLQEVGSFVNNSRNDGPQCIAPAQETGGLF